MEESPLKTFHQYLLTLFVYFTQLSPSGGAFLAEMAGQQTGLNGRETKLAGEKLVQKRPEGGTKPLK